MGRGVGKERGMEVFFFVFFLLLFWKYYFIYLIFCLIIYSFRAPKMVSTYHYVNDSISFHALNNLLGFYFAFFYFPVSFF